MSASVRFVTAVAVLGMFTWSLTGCPEGWRLIRVPGEPAIFDSQPVRRIEGLVKEAEKCCPKRLAPLVQCRSKAHLCRRDPRTGKQVASSVCRKLRPVVSFAFLSDAQLKEHRIQLHGPLTARSYDGITCGAHRNMDLAKYDYAVLLATVLGINVLATTPSTVNPYDPCPAPIPPAFALHAGDAVDSGMFSELFEFLAVMQRLVIPFYNVIGNHDNLFFGFWPADAMKGLNVTAPFIPIYNTDRFIRAHSSKTLENMAIPKMPRLSHGITQAPSRSKGRSAASLTLHSSHFHGFDLICPHRNGKLCLLADGYYELASQITAQSGRSHKLRLIVLNTAEVSPKTKSQAYSFRSRGKMREQQLRWLEARLLQAARDKVLVLVVGHHPLHSFVTKRQRRRLKRLLVRSRGVMAYLAGHTHVNAIHSHKRGKGAPPLWEIIAGSTLVYPQLAQIVELFEHDSDPREIYLRVRTFRQQLGDSRCSCGRTCARLSCYARLGRNGARADKDGDDDWRTQPQAAVKGNGLMRVRVP